MDSVDKSDVGERLKKARGAAGLSQAQVANMLGLHRPTISEIEAGRRNVNVDELKKFSDVYGVSINWLIYGDTSKNLIENDNLILAARELSNMNESDLEKLLITIRMIKSGGSMDDI